MAQFLLHNVFKLAALTLNYASPSILADVVLHPFDFATVLLQIGFDPEGIKDETATFVSVFIQYALFTLYVPCFLTSVQGLQMLGMPHPSIFYYVSYIYNKEGLGGCYRGLTPKIIERLVMIHTNDCVKQVINTAPGRGVRATRTNRDRPDEDRFLRTLVNNICCQFFAVLASHPFHVIMVSNFADFVNGRKSDLCQSAISIYKRDGYYGFTIGLAPRLVGELLSLIFSMVYTKTVNKQTRSGRSEENDVRQASAAVDYSTEFGRSSAANEGENVVRLPGNPRPPTLREERNTDPVPTSPPVGILLAYVPLTSKYFYWMIARDYVAKKISHPFFLVCHCMIVLDAGWEKFPLIPYFRPMVKFVDVFVPRREKRSVRSV